MISQRGSFSIEDRSNSVYKYWHTDSVRFLDIDALGHVSSVTINAYFAGARTQLFKETIDHWPRSSAIPVLRHSTIEYEGELYFQSEFQVGLRIERFGNTSLTLVMALFVENQCLSLNRNVFVFLNSKTRKPVDIPESIKGKMTALVQGNN